MTAKTKLQIGDKVRVPWGVGEVPGIIVRIDDGPSGQRYALVKIPVQGSSGETLEETEISFPERWLTIAA